MIRGKFTAINTFMCKNKRMKINELKYGLRKLKRKPREKELKKKKER